MAKIVSKYTVQLVRESNKTYDIDSKKVSGPGDAYEYVEEIFNLSNQAEEVVALLALDTKNKVVGAFEVSRGAINMSIMHPREVFQRAILANANSIILAHNHPSGDYRPSREDIDITDRLIEAGKILGIRVNDHIIVGDFKYISLKEKYSHMFNTK